uniref:non-specific serine/threonine protein kinase n=1 Tax=Poecilia formosa TaxID=48698 RepID=A0A087Y9R8_POEFO
KEVPRGIKMAARSQSSPCPTILSKKAKTKGAQNLQNQEGESQETSAPFFIRKLRKAAVGTGCDIRLRVSVSGHPKPSMTWYHNDELISPSEAQDSGGLWIRDCHTNDAGMYTCVASNDLGEASCSAVLAVMDLGEDSETTEDETTEPQMETKEGPGRHQDKVGRKGPSGEGGRMMDYNPDASDRRATLPGTYDPVVERELRALGSRPPGPHLDPTNPARQAFGGGPAEGVAPVRHLGVEPLIRASHANLARPVQGSEESVSVGSDYYGSMFSLYRGRTFSITLSFDLSDLCFDLISFEAYISVHAPLGRKCCTFVLLDSFLTAPQLRLPPNPHSCRNKTPEKSWGFPSHVLSSSTQPALIKNLDQDKTEDSEASKISGTGKVIMTPKLAHAGPKIFDKVRAFEERRRSVDLPGGAASVDSDDSGKKTGGPSKEEGKVLQGVAQKRAAFQQRASSLEDKTTYSQRVQSYQNKFAEELQRIKKLVKLEARERALEGERDGAPRVPAPLPGGPLGHRRENPRWDNVAQTAGGSSRESSGKCLVAMETEAVHQLPGQPLATATRKSLNRLEQSSSSSRDLGTHSNTDTKMENKSHHESSNPTGKRSSPVPSGELLSQHPPKSNRPSPALPPAVSPLLKKRRAEVEDEPMEEERPTDDKKGKHRTGRREGRVRKNKQGQPLSAEEGSSDDSYMSADEEPGEGPRFVKPLQDAMATAGSEVKLDCIITGKPPITVTWRKNNVELRTNAFYTVQTKGETHTLLIKELRAHDAGSYCVTAANMAGTSSCKATLSIHPGENTVMVSSPVQSDEEYLSPQEEKMECGDSPSLNKGISFSEPPSFQVPPCDQSVIEGQEVVIAAKIRGHPKPMVLWLKDKAVVKAGGRFAVREIADGTCEMRISAAHRSDTGLYVCKLHSECGTKQVECRVEVKDRAAAAQIELRITRAAEDVAVKAGESAIFECHITGPPDVEVDWLSNGKLIQPALLNCKMHFDGKRCRLMLNSVHEDDSGTYTCKLSTAKEELTSNANLRVAPSREPLFTRKLDILEVIEGRTARFDCKVSGSPAPRVTWMHFETRVEENDNIRILQEGGRHSLVISHVSSDKEGFYTAIAQNIYGKSECTAELYVQESRAAISSHMAKLEKMPSIPEEPEVLENELERRTMPDFVKPLADVEVIEGKEAVLKCKVSGLPYPTIAWYHNGKRIESSEERKMTQHRDVHSLVIRGACHTHGGVYKAVISNKVGKSACYAHLYVTDIVPDPPDGPPVIEAITGKTITLSWKRPKRLDPSLDASSLLFMVQQQPLGSIQWSVAASNLKETNYTVTSLSKGVRYAFRVLTSTGKTLSKPSPSTDLVQLLDKGPYLRKAPVILDKPDIVFVVENQPANVTVTLNHVHAVVTWKRLRGVALINRLGVYEMSMPDDDQHTLRIQRVRTSDIGQLVVTASNQFGSDLCTLQLAMAVLPKFESIMEDVDVHIGETSRLAVVVEGKPDPDILWFKDDLLLSESSHFTFVYDDPEYSLVILSAKQEHSGVYTCTAKNVAGSVSCKAELTVHTERKAATEPVEDEGTILRKMRHLTDYYDVHKEIGRGAFSYVKRVTLKSEKADFAAKFISARGKRKALALREMDLLSELDNNHILYFHDAFEKKNIVVLITELCHEEMLERMAKKSTVMEKLIRSCVQQILEGLKYLHQKNIAHLDVKPENILMASPGSDLIRICDFGNAIKLDTSEDYYCKYGTPEYVAPEIINQTPVSIATDIWPVGVITYLCLTGVSPFAGENDRATALNIRNYNVAFEEGMFSEICKEAKGFVIKLLVVDRLRPNAIECLRHPWFKSPTNKSISTSMLKQVIARRCWQRSLISYKSKMALRSIPELLKDSSSHVSIAVARHLKGSSPPPSSSSDSDADVDELPFIPMPLSLVFSGSRVSLNEIPGDEDVRWPTVYDEVETQNEERTGKAKREDLKKGSSIESNEAQTRARRATMRRGSSADSALLLHIDPEEGNANEDSGAGTKSLKKAVSMELPNRSPSPGATKLSQEDYTLKLELMRQRLLRGGSVDKKMSGLRGPLFETLGIGLSTLTRAASSERSGDDTPKTKVFCKSVSFSQGDSEPMPLHRRFGAPLEIPSASTAKTEGKKLQEAISMSVLTEQATLESESTSPKEKASFAFPATEKMDQEQNNCNVEGSDIDEATEKRTKADCETSIITSKIAREVTEKDNSMNEKFRVSVLSQTSTKGQSKSLAAAHKPNDSKSSDTSSLPEHSAVFAKVATGDRPAGSSSSSSNPDLTIIPRQPVLRTDIKDIDSVEVFEAKFKKRESSLTRGLRKLTRNKSEEKSPVLSRKTVEGGEDIYRPGPRGAPLEIASKGIPEKSKSVQDLREVDQETGLSLIGRFSLKGISAKFRSQSEERKAKETGGSQKDLEERDLNKVSESPVLAIRHKFENKVVGISSKIRSQSEERKVDGEGRNTPLFARHRHSHSEGRGLKGMGIPENQLAKQTGAAASKESIESTSSIHSDKALESDRRSRWDRWGLTRTRRDKTPSQSDLPSTAPKEEGLTKSQQFIRSASDFAPVFHIKLKDHVLLEWEAVTLSCLPAGSPHPEITWMKDRKLLEVTDNRIKLLNHPDGRQLLTIQKCSHREAGVYECVATNPIATVTTSCTLSIASVPKRPGTPEVAQTYNNTALVLWKPSDTKSPCSYSLERRSEADSNWVTVATGIADCYYNVTDLPPGGAIRFRVSCVNKAGQGPHSNCSVPVSLDSTEGGASPAVAVVKTVPTPPESALKPNPDVRVTSTFSTSPPPPSALTSDPPIGFPSLFASISPEEKQSSALPSSGTVKASPSFILFKPQSPINVVTPMTQTPPPLVSPPSTPTKPLVASVPSYVPTTATKAQVAPTPVSFSPPVLQASSLSPIAEGANTPIRGTPSGHSTPSTALRQGVPQKPYTFLDEKARGRFGVIRECRENATGKIYMAKIIPYSQDSKQGVLKEYEILKSLHSEKVMALHEAYVTPRYLVLVAEYCTGKELLFSLADRFRYSEDDVVGYLVQILQAVEYLHNRRVLHLDLKPENILVTNLNVVKIVDFGSAQSFNPLNLEPKGTGAGTLEYMAPEMIKGEVVGPPADIWTVGVVTYIMLSGRLPFEDKDPRQVESKILMAKFDPSKLYPNVSQSASVFLKKMLSSYPWARPTTRDCFTQAWLQDSYLMKLRRQTLTFTSSRLKEFLVEQQSCRTETATKHKVLLRTYQGSPRNPASGTMPHLPSPK